MSFAGVLLLGNIGELLVGHISLETVYWRSFVLGNTLLVHWHLRNLIGVKVIETMLSSWAVPSVLMLLWLCSL